MDHTQSWYHSRLRPELTWGGNIGDNYVYYRLLECSKKLLATFRANGQVLRGSAMSSRNGSESRRSSGRHYLSNATCLMRPRLFLCMFLSCQGSPYFATLFTTFEENPRWTSSVRQVVPSDSSKLHQFRSLEWRGVSKHWAFRATDEVATNDPLTTAGARDSPGAQAQAQSRCCEQCYNIMCY